MKKKLHCAYLFADGHAVLVYEKHDRQAGDIRWAEVVEKFGPECRFKGRIVFHWGSNGLLNLCRKAVAVRAKAPYPRSRQRPHQGTGHPRRHARSPVGQRPSGQRVFP